MKIKLIIQSVLLCFCSFIAALSYSQVKAAQEQMLITDNPLKSRLDSLVDKSVRAYSNGSNAVGLSIGIVRNNKTYFYNYGETENGNSNLPTNKTIYEIGSMTKTFTGILLAQAVLDEKVRLDDDVREYLEEEYPNLQYNGSPIRIVNLANHTSRITRIFPNLWEREEYDSLNPFSNYSTRLFFEGLHNVKMDTLPGFIDSYSNMAVGLLGCILEHVYNEDYFTLISKFILKPLEMSDTKIDVSNMAQYSIAKSHNEKGEPVPYWDMPDLPAIGALRSTTTDLTKYIYANNTDKTKSISLSHQLTFGTHQKGIALNWFVYTTANGYKALEHGGGTGGSRSSFHCFPELNSGFVLLTNSVANRRELEAELARIVTEQAK